MVVGEWGMFYKSAEVRWDFGEFVNRVRGMFVCKYVNVGFT